MERLYADSKGFVCGHCATTMPPSWTGFPWEGGGKCYVCGRKFLRFIEEEKGRFLVYLSPISNQEALGLPADRVEYWDEKIARDRGSSDPGWRVWSSEARLQGLQSLKQNQQN